MEILASAGCGHLLTSFHCSSTAVRVRSLAAQATMAVVTPELKTQKVAAKRKLQREIFLAESRAMDRGANASVYTPELLSLKYGSRPLKLFQRAFQILISLGHFLLKLRLDQRKGLLVQNRQIRAIEIREIFTNLGPTFVKFGQILSTRPDICPTEYLAELSRLQDSLPTFPNRDAFACIEKELGVPFDSVFDCISPSPVAAASLGQVYKAKLKCSGKLVAVKVQRPHIEETIGIDFYLIRRLVLILSKYVDFISNDFVVLIDEFARRLFQELNYVQEGLNAKRFKKLYADREDILVPDIFWEYTSPKVLTMEWINGTKLNEKEAIESQGLNVLDLVKAGIHCTLRQLLEYGYFHADPHPGNLLATPEGKLAFIDFGMMSETPEQARYALICHVVHMVNRDYEAMAHDYYALNFLTRDIDVSPIVPVLQQFFDDTLSHALGDVDLKSLMDCLGAVFYQYPFTVPGYYALILKSLAVLEGLALHADPNFKVLAVSYPYFAKRLLTDPNPYLRNAFIELLFKDGRFRWNRLENLLMEGRKDRDFSAKEVLQHAWQLLYSPNNEELRVMVAKEVVHVNEALLICAVADSLNHIPLVTKTLLFRGRAVGPLTVSDTEVESMMVLRNRVLKIWGLLRASKDFDPNLLKSILQVARQPESWNLGRSVIDGTLRCLGGHFVKHLLQGPAAVLSLPI